MTKSIPKSNSLISIGFFLLAVIAVDIWLFWGLFQYPESYFLFKLILAPTVFVIGIAVAIKSYSSALILTMGNNGLTYRYLFGSDRKHKITDVTNWQEEVVKRKSSEYRQLSIHLANGKKLKLSNLENTNYDKLVSYLRKKVKAKK